MILNAQSPLLWTQRRLSTKRLAEYTPSLSAGTKSVADILMKQISVIRGKRGNLSSKMNCFAALQCTRECLLMMKMWTCWTYIYKARCNGETPNARERRSELFLLRMELLSPYMHFWWSEYVWLFYAWFCLLCRSYLLLLFLLDVFVV